MRIFLIHGLGRSPASMWWLAGRLRIAGHQPSLFGYSALLETLPGIAERFTRHLAQVVDAGEGVDAGEKYAVIGHSLGNIITRLASPDLAPGFSRFIMLAPPNHPPAVARELQDHTLFQALASDTGQLLCDDEFYAGLPMPEVPALVIAGDRGIHLPWHPLGDVDNDAVVSVDEARLDGVPLVVVHGIHSFLMNRSDVFAHISRFLAEGKAADEI